MFYQLKTAIKSLIPFQYHYYFEKKRRTSAGRKTRKDVVHFEVADNAYFEVYWKVYGLGRGPALALFIEHEQVLKFDFYGKGRGHYHVQTMMPAPCTHHALFLPEETVGAQIDRAFFELEKNLYWYLERHPLKAVRNFRVKKAHLRQILTELRPVLVEYQNRVPPENSDSDRDPILEGDRESGNSDSLAMVS